MSNTKIVTLSIIGLLGVTFIFMAGCPAYNVYQQGKAGEAELERAEQNRKIVIEEAIADNEAAESEALSMVKIAHAKQETKIIEAQGQRQADSIRAIGVARSNEIIGSSLKDNQAYLRYLWVKGLYESDNNRIYIPTEANMPILEAK